MGGGGEIWVLCIFHAVCQSYKSPCRSTFLQEDEKRKNPPHPTPYMLVPIFLRQVNLISGLIPGSVKFTEEDKATTKRILQCKEYCA